MDLIDKIKAIAKEGVDFGEIEAELKTLNPLNSVTDKAEAWNFIKSNPLLMSTFDSEQNKRSEKTVENYKSGKMLEEWKAKEEELRKEFNPEETPEQKRIRELEAKDKARDAELARRDLEDSLSIKAKELDFDPIRAKGYSIYGEKAMEKLEDTANWMKAEIESKLSTQIKENYKGIKQPIQTKLEPADLDTKIREARQNGDFAGALRLQLSKGQTE